MGTMHMSLRDFCAGQTYYSRTAYGNVKMHKKESGKSGGFGGKEGSAPPPRKGVSGICAAQTDL